MNEQRVTALGIRRWNTRDAGSGIFEWVYDVSDVLGAWLIS